MLLIGTVSDDSVHVSEEFRLLLPRYTPLHYHHVTNRNCLGWFSTRLRGVPIAITYGNAI